MIIHHHKPRARGRPRGQDSTCRERLLEAALAAFAAQGYEAAGLRAIAAAAGCDVSMVAHYFGSKAELWTAVVDRLELRVREDMREIAALGTAGPLEARLVAAVDLMFEHAVRNREILRFIVRESAEPGERFDRVVGRLIKPTLEACLPLWQEAIDAGLFSVNKPLILHSMVFGGMSFLISAAPVMSRVSHTEMSVSDVKAEFLSGLFSYLEGRSASAGAQR
ncbi:TetR/AcrR family transcriptional regulator [Thauera sinica]|uniref:TetR/AcrR family transcriptional regulator n=1 Tax=Thauera sinica TaxID=2665146 RepID=A0ABW1ANQ8_9RHOO|nr:TetR/AcrR family transcriptional regulator [Thauera sp. K11]ATE62802.1 TetR family transcriptional regulator [Thauera sp. K11]